MSSCLLGEEVRFNGGHKRFRFLADELDAYVDWVRYCPEVEIGLGTPREPIRLTSGGRLVNRSETADHTAAMAALPVPGSPTMSAGADVLAANSISERSRLISGLSPGSKSSIVGITNR